MISMINKRIAILLAWIVLLVLLFWLGAKEWLTLDALQQNYQSFRGSIEQEPLLSILTFFLIYTLLTIVSFPGASILTLLAGALFGTFYGVLVVSFASTIGATGAFLIARYLLRDWVNQRFSQHIARFNQGFSEGEGFYLLSLRLAPLFPFFVINLLSGLTRIRTVKFYWVSQIGMLPGTIIYVIAGEQLSQLSSLDSILSLPLFLSLLALALFPLLVKRILTSFQQTHSRRKTLAKLGKRDWQRPKIFDRNVIVIGAGAAGLVSSYIAAMLKAKVTLIEKNKMGGDCLNYGCVPSKALIHAAKCAENATQYHRATAQASTDLSALRNITQEDVNLRFQHAMQHIQQSITAIAPHDSIERYTDLGVDVKQGEATIISPYEVQISQTRLQENGEPCLEQEHLTTRAIIIASGSKPIIPEISGLDTIEFLTTETIWQAFAERKQAPKHLVILGDGPIAVELAQAFSRIGIKISLLAKHSAVLPKEDHAVSVFAQQALIESNVDIYLQAKVTSCAAIAEIGLPGKQLLIEALPIDYTKAYSSASTATQQIEYEAEPEVKRELITLECDELLIAVGRKPNYAGIGLENLGLYQPNSDNASNIKQSSINQSNRNQSNISLDNGLASTVYPNIFLAGDCVGEQQFTHVAAHQAWYATVNALFQRTLIGRLKRFKVDYRVIPKCIYLDPVIARVGLNEKEARESNVPYEITQFDMAELDRAITESANQGFITVLTQPNSDRILGVTIVATRADDLIAEFTLAMKYKIGLRKLLSTIHPYPTWSEANKYVAGAWQKQRTSKRLLALAEYFFSSIRSK